MALSPKVLELWQQRGDLSGFEESRNIEQFTMKADTRAISQKFNILLVMFLASVLTTQIGLCQPDAAPLRGEAESAIRNLLTGPLSELQITVSGTLKESFPEQTSGKMTLNQEAHIVATFILGSQTVISLKLDPIKRRWVDGQSAYADAVESISYNGEFWTYFIDRFGPQGDMKSVRQAVISFTPPSYISKERYETFENIFLAKTPVSYMGKILPLRDMLLAQTSNPFKFRWLKHGDIQYLEIELSDKCTRRVWQVRPDKGYALAKATVEMNLCSETPEQDKIVTEFECSDFSLLAAGLHVPKTCVRTIRRGRVLLSKQEVKIDSVEVLSAAAHPNVFNTSIPLGSVVRDERFGVQFVVDETNLKMLTPISLGGDR